MLQPEAEKKIAQISDKDKEISKECQKDFEKLFREPRFQEILKRLGPTTLNTGSVHDNTILCPSCKTRSVPKRGGVLKDIKKDHEAAIYAPDNVSVYYCGSCGNIWERRVYTQQGETSGRTDDKPIYTKPDDGEGMDRIKRHGFGYSVSVRPFTQGDNQIAVLKGDDTVWINSRHPDYQTIKKSKIHTTWRNDALRIYEQQNGFDVILNHQMERAQKPPVEKERLAILQEMKNLVLVIVQTTARRDRKDAGATENAAPVASVQDLKNKMESKL